jgi:hypothetical protein
VQSPLEIVAILYDKEHLRQPLINHVITRFAHAPTLGVDVSFYHATIAHFVARIEFHFAADFAILYVVMSPLFCTRIANFVYNCGVGLCFVIIVNSVLRGIE